MAGKAWDDAVAEFGRGEPADLVRPGRTLVVEYRQEHGYWWGYSPQVDQGPLIGAQSLEMARRYMREELGRWLDPAVRVEEHVAGTGN